MARNRFPGKCYRCGIMCPAGDGHFEKFGDGFRVQHATCAIHFRGTPDPGRIALSRRMLEAKAAMTGKRATRARKRLRELDAAQPAINLEDF